MPPRPAALLGVLLLVGCSARIEPSQPVQPSPSVQATLPVPSPHLERPPPAAPSIEATWLAAQAVTCGDDLFFSPTILAEPGHEEDGLDPASAALREFLGRETTEQMASRPHTGWHRVAQTATQVQFVAVGVDRRDLWVIGFQVRNGAWELVLDGACQGQAMRPNGLGPADWWLDPAFGAPAPQDSIVHGWLVEGTCASARSPEGRIARPVIAYLEDAVVVTMSVRPLPGAQDCPGNPRFAIKIQLDQPLGDRRLVDGGRIPPRDAALPPI